MTGLGSDESEGRAWLLQVGNEHGQAQGCFCTRAVRPSLAPVGIEPVLLDDMFCDGGELCRGANGAAERLPAMCAGDKTEA